MYVIPDVQSAFLPWSVISTKHTVRPRRDLVGKGGGWGGGKVSLLPYISYAAMKGMVFKQWGRRETCKLLE